MAKPADKARKNLNKIRKLLNPCSHIIVIHAMLPLSVFVTCFVAFFVEQGAFKTGAFIWILIFLPLIIVLEKRGGWEKDYDLNSVDFQLAVAMTGSLAIGGALGYDPEQMYLKAGQYFLAVNFFVVTFSIMSVIDNIRLNYSSMLPNPNEHRKKEFQKIISCARMKFFPIIFLIYVVVPLVLGVLIGHFIPK